MKPASEWQAYLVRKLPGAPLDAAIEKLQAEAWKAGAADMRERAALVSDEEERKAQRDWDHARVYEAPMPVLRHVGRRVRALPLTAPSARVPVDETTKGGG